MDISPCMLINPVQPLASSEENEFRRLVMILKCALYSAAISLCSECDITPLKFVCLALALQTVEELGASVGEEKGKFTFQFSSR